MTNLDIIKNMNVEEMANVLNDSISIFNCLMCKSNPKQGSCKKKSCIPSIINWLNSECEVVE